VVGVVGLLGSREGEGELRANRERTLFRRERSGTPEGCQVVKGQEVFFFAAVTRRYLCTTSQLKLCSSTETSAGKKTRTSI
jgi:hypothetical protein